jgi:hypothetical protein
MLRPAVVLPIHDPEGIFLPHLERITPLLESTFAQAILNLPPSTRQAQPGAVSRLEANSFFILGDAIPESPVGDHFRALYGYAARLCPPEQVLHLCYIDRLAYALQSSHCETFLQDVQAITAAHTPLIFHRSAIAWDTHPANYRDIEGMITRAGEWLFHKTLDFAWCHLAVRAGLLAEILPRTHQSDLSIVTEIVLEMLGQVKTKDVDWLAWEDPFILGRDPQALKAERENDPAETRKRLAYAIKMMTVQESYVL